VSDGPQLIVRYPSRPPRLDLSPGDGPLFLDRQFLRPHDRSVSRRPDAPVLLFRAGDWWLDNECRRLDSPTVFSPSLGRRVDVPYGCSFRLRAGENELHLWKPEYQLSLTVVGAVDPIRDEPASGLPTVFGSPEADQKLRSLFHRSPHYKRVLAALYREYLTAGVDRPKELARQDAADCLGGETNEVSDAKKAAMKAIWGENGHNDQLPHYLINRQFLTPADQTLVPHRRCNHRPATKRGQSLS
jgi:hypothetical protein